MKIIAVIPARYASTRFPAKLMQDLGGKTVIQRTYESAINTRLFDDVFVVTDSVLIYDEISNNGGKAIMSIKEHESGSDRIAEAVENLDVDIVVNVQGDEPFINKEPLAKVLEVFRNDFEKKIDLASLMFEITTTDEIENTNKQLKKVPLSKRPRQLFSPAFQTDELPQRRPMDKDRMARDE